MSHLSHGEGLAECHNSPKKTHQCQPTDLSSFSNMLRCVVCMPDLVSSSFIFPELLNRSERRKTNRFNGHAIWLYHYSGVRKVPDVMLGERLLSSDVF